VCHLSTKNISYTKNFTNLTGYAVFQNVPYKVNKPDSDLN